MVTPHDPRICEKRNYHIRAMGIVRPSCDRLKSRAPIEAHTPDSAVVILQIGIPTMFQWKFDQRFILPTSTYMSKLLTLPTKHVCLQL